MAGENAAPSYEEMVNEDDPFKLAELVESGGALDTDPGEAKPNLEQYRGHQLEDQQTPSRDDDPSKETKTDTDAGKSGGDQTKTAADDAGTGKEADAGKEGGDDAAGDKDKRGTAVKTADGEGEIPYAVLKNTREQNAQLKAEVSRLSEELEAAKKGGESADTSADPEEMTPEQRQEHIKALEDEIQSVEDDYDPDLAKPMRRLLEESLRLAKRVDRVDEALNNQPTAEDREQEQEIMDAIDNSGPMAEWYSRSDETWYQRAVQVHQAAVQSDEAYQAMSHRERMQELPRRVQAVFGADPELVAAMPESKQDTSKQASADKSGEADKSKQGGSKSADEDIVPRSMDDLPPGGTADTAGKYGPIGDMDGAKMTEYFGRLADQGKLDDVLNNFSG